MEIPLEISKIIFLLSPVYATLFWAVALLSQYRSSNNPKTFVGFIMLVAFLLYLSHFFYFTRQLEVYRYLDSIYTLALLLVYPLFHIYVRLLTTDFAFTFRNHWPHLFPAILLASLTVLGHLLLGREGSLAFLQQMENEGHPSDTLFRYMNGILLASRLIFILQAAIYMVLNFILLDRNKKRVKDYYSNIESRGLGWVYLLNFAMVFTSLSSITLAVLGKEFFLGHPLLLLMPSIIFTTMLFLLGYYGQTQKPSLTTTTDDRVLQLEASTGAEAVPAKLKESLEYLFTIERVYKNPELKIWDVTRMLNTNRTYVSKLINQEYGRNFCNHVNYYRVQYAKWLIDQDQSVPNEVIADQSGFGSVNSLYRAFQGFEEIPIGEYRKQKRVLQAAEGSRNVHRFDVNDRLQ